MTVTGYHGTDENACASIRSKNFKVNASAEAAKKNWYGPGAYFFIEGITACPVSDARMWALNRSLKPPRFKRYSVLRVDIESEKPFDLRSQEGLKRFNTARKFYLDHLGTERPVKESFDQVVVRRLMSSNLYDCLIINGYSQMTDHSHFQTPSRIPNCTIVMVPNPKKCISLDSIHEHENGPTSP